jgi:restriction system protein
MSIPDYQSLMLPVLVACARGEVRIGSVVDDLANQLGLSPEERTELLPSGQQTVFSNRVHWAKSYLSKAQLVEITRRGIFQDYAARADGPPFGAPKD